jgi:glycosyltransferase involved in cell wall biosynthesis
VRDHAAPHRPIGAPARLAPVSATGGDDRDGARSIIQVTLWNSPYLGNFMASELVLAEEVRERFGLATHFVLGDGADGQPWLSDLEQAGTTWSVLSPRRSDIRGHLDRAIDEHSAALLHAHFTYADLPAASAAAAAGIPCVWHIRTGFNGYPLRRRATDLYKMRIVARRRVARIVAVSPWLGELAHRRGVPADRIEVVPNAILFERFAELPDRAAARERFGLDPDAEVVLGLGWWPEVKGVDLFLEALAPIAAERPKLEALLVGEEMMRTFLANHTPQRPPWLHLSGFVSDPAWLFAAADIFVSASRHEGQSGAVGEAIACGLPVVMSDIGGHAAWTGAPSALMFHNGDVPGLTARLEGLLEQTPEDRASAGAENRAWARASAGVEQWSAGMCGVYAELL